jgi:hypothetical protein
VGAHGTQAGDTIVNRRVSAKEISQTVALEWINEEKVGRSGILVAGYAATPLDFFQGIG